MLLALTPQTDPNFTEENQRNRRAGIAFSTVHEIMCPTDCAEFRCQVEIYSFTGLSLKTFNDLLYKPRFSLCRGLISSVVGKELHARVLTLFVVISSQQQ